MGDLNRFQGCILPHTHPELVQEVHTFSHPGQAIPIQSTTIWPLHSSYGVYYSGQRGQVSCTTKGYKDPPVPRRLVGQSQIPPGLSPANKDTNIPLSGVRLASKPGEIRAGPQTSIQFCRLPVRLERGQGQTHPRALADLTGKDKRSYVRSGMPGSETDVLDRITNSSRETSAPRAVTHETYPVTFEKQLESLGKQIPVPKSLHPHLRWWLEEDNVLQGQALHPLKHALQIFTDTSKEVWGPHLDEHTARGTWSLPESQLHINYLKLKAVLLALKQFQDLC